MPAINTGYYTIDELEGWSQTRIAGALERVAKENSDKYYLNDKEQINDIIEYLLMESKK